MLALNATYYNGQLQLEKKIKISKPVKVIVTFLKEVVSPKEKENEKSEGLKLSDFSFYESREVLKDMKGSLSEAVIEERRSYL